MIDPNQISGAGKLPAAFYKKITNKQHGARRADYNLKSE